MAGVLQGVTVIELAGIGPGPFCGMMLADHGARVIRVERPGTGGRFGDGGNRDILNRSRTRIELDLKDPAGIEQLKDMVKDADALIEGYRPGVIERMGIGPDVLLAINPKLVIGRMTGWGQQGPMAPLAGHDINYIALSGALHSYGRAGEKPTFPVNAVGDFGHMGLDFVGAVDVAVTHEDDAVDDRGLHDRARSGVDERIDQRRRHHLGAPRIDEEEVGGCLEDQVGGCHLDNSRVARPNMVFSVAAPG